jgi:hypothetical protein
MHTTLNILACLFALLGALVIVSNWVCVIVSSINKHRGIDRHHSMVPLVAQILFILSDVASSFALPRILSTRVLLIAALTDISLLSLVAWPFVLLFRHRKLPK